MQRYISSAVSRQNVSPPSFPNPTLPANGVCRPTLSRVWTAEKGKQITSLKSPLKHPAAPRVNDAIKLPDVLRTRCLSTPSHTLPKSQFPAPRTRGQLLMPPFIAIASAGRSWQSHPHQASGSSQRGIQRQRKASVVTRHWHENLIVVCRTTVVSARARF